MSRLTLDGTAETVSRDQLLRRERGQGNINFPCSADHEQVWQPYPVDSNPCYICDDHTYIHTYIGAQDGNGDGSGDGAGTGTGTGVGTRRRTQAGDGDGNGDRSEDCSGDGNEDDDNGNENRIGEGERRQKSARNRKIAVDAARETGEKWVESETNVEKKGLIQ